MGSCRLKRYVLPGSISGEERRPGDYLFRPSLRKNHSACVAEVEPSRGPSYPAFGSGATRLQASESLTPRGGLRFGPLPPVGRSLVMALRKSPRENTALWTPIVSVERERRRVHERHQEMENNDCVATALTPKPSSRSNLSSSPLSLGSPEEGWRLMRTFLRITNPAVRSVILDMVSALERQDLQRRARDDRATPETFIFDQGSTVEDRRRTRPPGRPAAGMLIRASATTSGKSGQAILYRTRSGDRWSSA